MKTLKRSQSRKTGLSLSLLLILGFRQCPEERRGNEFWGYCFFLTSSLFTICIVSRLSSTGKTGPCVCHWHVTVYVHHLWKAGFRRSEALAGPGWVQTLQVLPALAARDTTKVNWYPSFSGAAPGLKSLDYVSKEILWHVILSLSLERVLQNIQYLCVHCTGKVLFPSLPHWSHSLPEEPAEPEARRYEVWIQYLNRSVR